MNAIPKDPYADALLLEIKTSVPGALLIRDAYAEALLNGVHDGSLTSMVNIDDKVPTYVAPKDLEKHP